MYEPTEPFRDKTIKIGASVDRIIFLSNEVKINSFVFDGEGILEIKSDFYHEGICRNEWIVQV